MTHEANTRTSAVLTHASRRVVFVQRCAAEYILSHVCMPWATRCSAPTCAGLRPRVVAGAGATLLFLLPWLYVSGSDSPACQHTDRNSKTVTAAVTGALHRLHPSWLRRNHGPSHGGSSGLANLKRCLCRRERAAAPRVLSSPPPCGRLPPSPFWRRPPWRASTCWSPR